MKLKKKLSLILCVAMVLSTMGMAVFAVDGYANRFDSFGLSDPTNTTESYLRMDMYEIYAEESLEIQLWSEDTQLSRTTWAKDYPVDTGLNEYLSCAVMIKGTSDHWNTTWIVEPSYKNVPTKAVLVIDGKTTNEMIFSDVKALKDVVTVDSWAALEGVAKAPTGKFAYSGYVEGGSREYIAFDLYNVYAEESIVIELWSGQDHLSTTTYSNSFPVDKSNNYLTGNVCIKGAFFSWDTEWHIAPTVKNIPDAAKLYVDGVLIHSLDKVFLNDGEKAQYLALSGVSAAAKIGDVKYGTLKEAIDAATTGATVTLLSNVELEETLTIAADKTITLDLAGKTISQTKEQTAGYQMILNDGNLTINDSVGGGKISYTDSGNGGEYISDTIYNRGTLVVNGGTIENLSSSTVATNGYPHAIDTYSGIRNTSVTINDGTVYCAEYSAIRMFCVSATNAADLTINGGTVRGAIDMQNGTKDSALGSLTINDGTFETTKNANNIRFANWNGGATEYGISAAITGGTFNGGLTKQYVPAAANWDSKIVSGGTFTIKPEDEFAAEGYEFVQNEDGMYSVESAGVLATENVLIQNMAQGTTTGADGQTVPTYRVGCFAAIDSANYSLLGIEVKADNGKVTGSGTTQYLYTYINVTNSKGEVTKILPETLGETNKYIFGRIMAFTTNYTDFSFRPFAVSLDGKKTFYGNWSKEYTVDPE